MKNMILSVVAVLAFSVCASAQAPCQNCPCKDGSCVANVKKSPTCCGKRFPLSHLYVESEDGSVTWIDSNGVHSKITNEVAAQLTHEQLVFLVTKAPNVGSCSSGSCGRSVPRYTAPAVGSCPNCR